MSATTLRSLLIHFGWISFFGLPISSAMLVFGPYLSVPGSIQNFGSYPYIQFLIVAFAVPGVTAISFWAAHNLKNLVFLKSTSLAKFLFLCVFLNVLSFMFSLIALPLEVTIYGPDTGSLIASSGYAVATFFYAFTSSLLLLFARKQVLAKSAGDNIKEPTLSETFS